MRTYIKYIILVSILSIPFIATGQLAVELSVNDAVVRRSGDDVEVTFSVETERFPGDQKLSMVPVVYDKRGNAFAMEPITLAGRRKGISDKRAGKAADLVTKGKTAARYNYRSSAAWEPWMTEVSVSVYRFGESCIYRYEEPSMLIAADRLIHYDIIPAFSTEKIEIPAPDIDELVSGNPFLRSAAGYSHRFQVMQGDGESAATVYFRVGKSDIDPSFRDNEVSLRALSEAYKMIEDDPATELRKIHVAGFASPEGSRRFNLALGERRAKSIGEYLKGRFGADDVEFDIHNGGENWEGLRRMVEESDMPEREKVLYIIDSHDDEDEMRKQKLKHFAKGVPYQYMNEHFFPELRSAGHVNIHYEIYPAPAEPDRRQEELVNALNAARELMMLQRWQEALFELDKVDDDDARAYNPRGVCHMMLGNYDEAGMWLIKALESGDEYAPSNLIELEMAKRVIK